MPGWERHAFLWNKPRLQTFRVLSVELTSLYVIRYS